MSVFVLVLAVPALLVVLLGYVVGYGLWAWIWGSIDAAAGTSLASWAEAAGWGTGLLTLAVSVRLAVGLLRRRRASGGGGRRPPPWDAGPG
jgi:hypothetical protein